METWKTAMEYEDIIQLPHHQSDTHPRMSVGDRAAQFAPFAALTGYEDAVKETARLTEEKKELSQDARAELDQKLAELFGDLKQTEAISVCYFSEDEKKAGGAYLTKRGKVKTIDRYRRELVWADGSRIRLDDIVEVWGSE